MFIQDPLENSMASFNFTVTLEEGATFFFGSWVCVADGVGNFHCHLTHTKKLEASSPTFRCDINKCVDDLDEI